MRACDNLMNWDLRIGEVEIYDRESNYKYFLVVGYVEINKVYCRLYYENNELVFGRYFSSLINKSYNLRYLNLSPIVFEEIIKQINRLVSLASII